MGRVVFVALLTVTVAACNAPTPSAAPGSPSPATGTRAPADRQTPGPTPSPAPTPTGTPAGETDEPSPTPDPASFLQVCHAPPRASDVEPIGCGEAVKAALAGHRSSPRPSRIDVRFGCGSVRSCTEPDPDRVFVTLLSEGVATRLELRRMSDGTLAIAGAGAGRPPSTPAFVPPPAARASLTDPPPEIATRIPYPLCGDELVEPDGPYDVAARRCFLAGVLAGSPVEFAQHGAGTEGVPFATLYRFAGSGGVERIDGEGGAWTRTVTGIRPVGGTEVFALDGLQTVPAPVP
jgi:hypothetical protein